jgi:TonB family protein
MGTDEKSGVLPERRAVRGVYGSQLVLATRLSERGGGRSPRKTDPMAPTTVKRAALRHTLCLLVSATLLAPQPAAAQFVPAPSTSCTGGYYALLMTIDPQRSELRIIGPHAFVGNVGLFGRTLRSHIVLDGGSVVSPRGLSSMEQQVVIRSAEAIAAASFRPAGASCDVAAVAGSANAARAGAPAWGARSLDATDDGVLDAVTCAQPYVPADAIRAVPPDMPVIAQQQGITGRVVVLVGVDETGALTSAQVQASPSKMLNAASLFAARRSTYRPAIVQCRPVASTAAFIVDFVRQ